MHFYFYFYFLASYLAVRLSSCKCEIILSEFKYADVTPARCMHSQTVACIQSCPRVGSTRGSGLVGSGVEVMIFCTLDVINNTAQAYCLSRMTKA